MKSSVQLKARLELRVKNLSVSIENKQILHGIDLSVKPGKFHAVMGPNGSGKSTLTYALMGHPSYIITSGQITLGKKNLLELMPYERAKAGLMLAFQNPIAVPGVNLASLLKTAYTEIHGTLPTVVKFHQAVQAEAKKLGFDLTFLRRGLNDGFSGGEKKKAEMLALTVLKPKIAIFDEIDTGLDVDALKLVSRAINILQEDGCGILLITHYQRILNYIKPDRVHIMVSGKIVREGGPELAKFIEKDGYANI